MDFAGYFARRFVPFSFMLELCKLQLLAHSEVLAFLLIEKRFDV